MSDASARPGLFILREKYTWVACDQADYGDVSAEIRTNLSHDERAAFVEASNRIKHELRAYLEGRMAKAAAIDKAVRDAPTDKAKALAIAKRHAFMDDQDRGADPFRVRRLELIAPYIRDWNIGTLDADGTEVKVPPPMDGGIASFAHTDDVVVAWLVEAIEQGYRGGKGLRTPSSASALSPVRTNAPPDANETEPST